VPIPVAICLKIRRESITIINLFLFVRRGFLF